MHANLLPKQFIINYFFYLQKLLRNFLFLELFYQFYIEFLKSISVTNKLKRTRNLSIHFANLR